MRKHESSLGFYWKDYVYVKLWLVCFIHGYSVLLLRKKINPSRLQNPSTWDKVCAVHVLCHIKKKLYENDKWRGRSTSMIDIGDDARFPYS